VRIRETRCKNCQRPFLSSTKRPRSWCSDECRTALRLSHPKAEASRALFAARATRIAREEEALKAAKIADKAIVSGDELNEVETEAKLKVHRPTTPQGRYVYGWYDGELLLYIGKGAGRRAWNPHKEWCRAERRKSHDFHVIVFRDGLTNEGASLVESVLIDVLKPLCNAIDGIHRQEVPPLELRPIQSHMMPDSDR